MPEEAAEAPVTPELAPVPRHILKSAWQFLRALLATIFDWIRSWRDARKRRLRPWQVFISSRAKAGAAIPGRREALLTRHKSLGDIEKLADFAAGFGLPESSYFADPVQAERLMNRLLADNPPWLHVNRVLAGGEAGAEAHSQEFLYREQVVREYQDIELFMPDDSWRDRPLASLTMRPARSINEMWSARLLDQILPATIQVDRCSRGEIMVPLRNPVKQRLEFRKEVRRVEVVTRKQVPIAIDSEGGSGKGGQLLYILLDFSSSMRGSSAVLALAVIMAAIRAHIGQKSTRYLFRRYAQKDQMWPNRVERPLQAITLDQKDALIDKILATNFNGSATDVNDALTIAAKDIERLRETDAPDTEILLVTDGRAEMLESTRLNLLKANARVHTVMVVPEPNPALEKLSESFTALDIAPDLPPGSREKRDVSVTAAGSQPVRRFRI
jgi:hypothetical protein